MKSEHQSFSASIQLHPKRHICFGVLKKGNKSVYQQYVTKLKVDLHKAHQLFVETADRNHKKKKKTHDKLVREQVLEERDRVLLRNFGITGKHKLKDKWRAMPYIVVGKIANVPVYIVKPERGPGVVKSASQSFVTHWLSGENACRY